MCVDAESSQIHPGGKLGRSGSWAAAAGGPTYIEATVDLEVGTVDVRVTDAQSPASFCISAPRWACPVLAVGLPCSPPMTKSLEKAR
jgi:hypothetical protein